MVRGSAEAKESLINHGGVTVLVKDMQANNVNLQTKAAFLMAYLAHSSEKLKSTTGRMFICRELLYNSLHI